MSVCVTYPGRVGNHFFQYACMRLFAARNDLAVQTSWCHTKDFFPVTEPPNGRKGEGPPIVLGDGLIAADCPDLMTRQFPLANYHLCGFFQRASWYEPHRSDIKKWFIFPSKGIDKKDDKNIVMHLRLGDYLAFGIISPDWYIKILEHENFNRLVIVTDKISQKDEGYLRKFDHYDPIIVSQSPSEDFDFLRNCNKLICSNSTFCWWAAFLGDAEVLYTFKPRIPRLAWQAYSAPTFGTAVEGELL